MEKHVLLADDHLVVRKGLSLLFESEFGIRNIDEAESCSQIMSFLKRKAYSHLVLDIVFADGIAIEIMPAMRRLYPELRIIIFSMQPENIYKNALATFGINDFISKSYKEKDTIQAFKRFFYSDRKSVALNPIDKSSPLMNLAPRELEVMHYMLNGKTVSEIATTLALNSRTVSTLKLRIFKKSNVKNILDLKELASLYDKRIPNKDE